jgi:hypothetical protein
MASRNLQFLNFVLEDGTLHVRQLATHPERAPEFSTEARSLESLIKEFPQLPKKTTLVVAFKLAWSAVYLCGGSWLSQIWNDENIWFIQRGENQIPPHPYLGTCLPGREHQHDCTPECFGCINQQKSPHILQLTSLGLMLMELSTGKTVSEFAKDKNLIKANTVVIADHFFHTYWRKIHEKAGSEYLSAIKACLRRNFGVENGQSIPLEELRTQMLRCIVGPLHEALLYYCPLRADVTKALADENTTLLYLETRLGPEPNLPAAEIDRETHPAASVLEIPIAESHQGVAKVLPDSCANVDVHGGEYAENLQADRSVYLSEELYKY